MEKHFYNILWHETARRDKHPGEVVENGTAVPAWAKHERLVLLKAVNEARTSKGLGPVTEDEIRQGEHVGDPNYGQRLAAHCASLVG